MDHAKQLLRALGLPDVILPRAVTEGTPRSRYDDAWQGACVATWEHLDLCVLPSEHAQRSNVFRPACYVMRNHYQVFLILTDQGEVTYLAHDYAKLTIPRVQAVRDWLIDTALPYLPEYAREDARAALTRTLV